MNRLCICQINMLFGILALLVCGAIRSTRQDSIQSEGILQPYPQDETSPGLNELVPPKHEEDISYKSVTLGELQDITDKQARCLKINGYEKNVLYAPLWAPPSKSKRHAKIKVVCNRKTGPKLWFGHSKYLDEDSTNIPIITRKDVNTATVNLEGLSEALSVELNGCNVCAMKNDIDPNYADILLVSVDVRKKKKVPSQYQPKKFDPQVRRKRDTSSVTLSRYSSYKRPGDFVEVSCSAPTSKVTWLDPVDQEIGRNIPHLTIRNTFTSSNSNSAMMFSNIQERHGGSYTCTANINGRTESAVFNLTVEPPVVWPRAFVTPATTELTLEEGEDYYILCLGNSEETLWKDSSGAIIPEDKNELRYYQKREPNQNKATLYLYNVTSKQSGVFICAVSRSGRVAVDRVTVRVNPAKLTFSPDNKDQIIKTESEDYEITCEGPVNSITWTFNGVEVSKNKDEDVHQRDPDDEKTASKFKKRSTLKFEDIQKTNEGAYVCSGDLILNGSKIERSFNLFTQKDNSLKNPKLRVNGKPLKEERVYLKVNETFELACKGETEKIFWDGPAVWRLPQGSLTSDTLQIQKVKKKKLSLKFKKASIQDEGYYRCVVEKGDVSKTAAFTLIVIEPGYFINPPTNPSAIEGGNVTLECNVGGHPKPQLFWSYDDIDEIGRRTVISLNYEDQRFSDTPNTRYVIDGDTFVIKNISYHEAGKYSCTAVQPGEKGSTISRAFKIDLQHKPYPVRNYTEVEKKLDTVSKLKCNMVANPAPYYTWFIKTITNDYNILALPSVDPEITINFDDPSKLTEYKCEASNIYGSGEQHVLVIPMEPPTPPKVELIKISKDTAYFVVAAEKNSSFTHYKVEYKKYKDGEWSAVDARIGDDWDTLYELPNLQHKTAYDLRVRSVNDLGISEPSNDIEFTTSSGIRLIISSVLIIISVLNAFLIA